MGQNAIWGSGVQLKIPIFQDLGDTGLPNTRTPGHPETPPWLPWPWPDTTGRTPWTSPGHTLHAALDTETCTPGHPGHPTEHPGHLAHLDGCVLLWPIQANSARPFFRVTFLVDGNGFFIEIQKCRKNVVSGSRQNWPNKKDPEGKGPSGHAPKRVGAVQVEVVLVEDKISRFFFLGGGRQDDTDENAHSFKQPAGAQRGNPVLVTTRRRTSHAVERTRLLINTQRESAFQKRSCERPCCNAPPLQSHDALDGKPTPSNNGLDDGHKSRVTRLHLHLREVRGKGKAQAP